MKSDKYTEAIETALMLWDDMVANEDRPTRFTQQEFVEREASRLIRLWNK